MTTQTKLLISGFLILIGVLARTGPHIHNIAPIAAIALFSAVYLGRSFAFILPPLAMFIGDLFIGFYNLPLMITVYGSFSLIGVIGLWVKKNKNLETVLLGSISSSVLFFLLTNWAVWQFSPWYQPTLVGLIESYNVAIPFFRHTIAGDLIYTTIFFGAFESATYIITNLKQNNVQKLQSTNN